MTNACNPSVRPGSELPYRINGTFICGVNPFVSSALLASCCLGPITNITTPAPTSGPYSDSWPLTCLAYCAITRPPDGPPYTYPFADCMNPKGSTTVIGTVCTEVDGFAPNECVPFHESPGCTSTNSHATSTYWPSGYTSVGTTATEPTSKSSPTAGSLTTGSVGGPVTGSATDSGSARSSSTATASAATGRSCSGTKKYLWKTLLAMLLVSFLAS